MKIWSALFLFALTLTGCGSDEFDDTRLINNLSGTWTIDHPYIGVKTDDGDVVKYISSSYPYLNYQLTITADGTAVLGAVDELGDFTVIKQGSVKGISKITLEFDKNLSAALNEIGNFEATTHRQYQIVDEDGSNLELNYSFKNSSDKSQYEGFVLERIGS